MIWIECEVGKRKRKKGRGKKKFLFKIIEIFSLFSHSNVYVPDDDGCGSSIAVAAKIRAIVELKRMRG